jgi:ribonuclease P protein component
MSWSRHRLHSPAEFRLATRGGARSARSHVVVHLSLRNGGDEVPRVGFVVSKKIGNSVVRHRVTRRLREIVRPRLAGLPHGTMMVVRALPGIDDVAFSRLSEEFDAALARARASEEGRR